MNRRQFLSSSIAAALGLSACGGSSSSSNGGGGNASFKRTFFIPEELTGNLQNGRVQYNLTLQTGLSRFLDNNINTATWGINGKFLGPTLRLKNGDSVDIHYQNTLPEATTIHGHGMHVPANMDGGVHQIIPAGQTWTSSYTVNQHASTNWYHPHLMGKTAEHVMHGLAGLIIIDDSNTETLDLPKQYGVDDIPVIVQDRRFNADGSFDYNPSRREIMHGWKGDTYLVNGVIKPYLELEAKQIRFRILNGSNARIYNFAFASGRSFKQIATDNALLETPVELTQLRLSPAERAEIVVDFSDAKGKNDIFIDSASNAELFKVNIKNQDASNITQLPNSLISLAQLNPADAVNTRSFTLSGRRGQLMINGQAMNKTVINESIPINNIEIWEIINAMGMDHNFHIHATHFQLLERNGSANAVAANERGYKDTVYIPPGESVKIILKMTDYADATIPYMYHCHILEHEDAGMMGQFVVV